MSSLEENEGVCELNDKVAVLPIEGKELEFDEEAVYIHFEGKEVRKFCYTLFTKIMKTTLFQYILQIRVLEA